MSLSLDLPVHRAGFMGLSGPSLASMVIETSTSLLVAARSGKGLATLGAPPDLSAP